MFLPGDEGAINAFKQRRSEGDTGREEYDGKRSVQHFGLILVRVPLEILVALIG